MTLELSMLLFLNSLIFSRVKLIERRHCVRKDPDHQRNGCLGQRNQEQYGVGNKFQKIQGDPLTLSHLKPREILPLFLTVQRK